MGDEWKTVGLSEIYEFSSGLSKPRSEFGFGQGFLTFKDVLDNYFVPSELSALVNSTEKERANCSISRGDVFLTRTSETQHELGMSCVALKDYPEATFNGFTKRLRPKSSIEIVPEYAAYFFRSPRFRRDVTSMSTLSTRASLNNEMLSRLSIVLPPIDQQKAIGFVLKALDDKIELNRRWNRTLEAMARAIFQSWFVDFDPVKAKAAGRTPPGLKPEIAALFPDRFEDSPLGPIPKGWWVGTLGNCFRLTMGQSPPGNTYNETGDGLPFYQGRTDFGFRFPTRRVYCTAPTRIAMPGDTLVSVRAPVGDVNLATEECAVGRGVAAVRHSRGSRSLSYYAMLNLSSHFNTFEAEGTVFGSINKADFAKLPFLESTDQILAAFEEQVAPLDDKIEILDREIATLASLRDALLPKLISGELRVPDAERIVGRGV